MGLVEIGDTDGVRWVLKWAPSRINETCSYTHVVGLHNLTGMRDMSLIGSTRAEAKGTSATHIAAASGQREILELLLLNGADSNVTDMNGATPLHFAANRGVVAVLFRYQAKTDMKTTSRWSLLPAGSTPLHSSVHFGDVTAAMAKVAAGSNVSARTKTGYTALSLACRFGNTSLVRYLYPISDKIIDPIQPAFAPLFQAVRGGHWETTEYLLLVGADPQWRSEMDASSLLHVFIGGSEICSTLIKAGLDPNYSRADGKTPLHTCHSAEAIRELLRAGANVNRQDSCGNTPLWYAMPIDSRPDKKSLHCVRALLDAGADPNLKNDDGKSPLDVVVHRVQDAQIAQAISKELFDHGAQITQQNRKRLAYSIKHNIFWSEPEKDTMLMIFNEAEERQQRRRGN